MLPQSTTHYRLEFQIKDLDTSREIKDLIAEVERCASAIVQREVGDAATLHTHVKREEAIALDPLTVIITLEVAGIILKPMLDGFFKRLGEKLAEELMENIDNLVISAAGEERETEK